MKPAVKITQIRFEVDGVLDIQNTHDRMSYVTEVLDAVKPLAAFHCLNIDIEQLENISDNTIEIFVTFSGEPEAPEPEHIFPCAQVHFKTPHAPHVWTVRIDSDVDGLIDVPAMCEGFTTTPIVLETDIPMPTDLRDRGPEFIMVNGEPKRVPDHLRRFWKKDEVDIQIVEPGD